MDLTYITNYIIACGFPAVGMDAMYRNSRVDIIRFLKLRHGNNVKIINLCVESKQAYEQKEIPDFGYRRCPFADHNIQSISGLFYVCLDIYLFL